MKKKLLALALSASALVGARADIIYIENFAYSNGPISFTSTNASGTTNWAVHNGNNDDIVNNNRLEIAASSGPLGRTGDAHRNFSGAITNTQNILYSSFVVNCTNLPPAVSTYFAHFYVNSSTFHGRVFAQAGLLTNTWRLGISGANNVVNQVFPVDLATNADYQVVVRWNPTTDNSQGDKFAARLWVNPIGEGDVNLITGDATGTPAASVAYAFRQANGFGSTFLTVSNLVVATTFNEAATNVLATNAAAPTMVYQPVTGTNFVGDPMNIFAVADGQGIAGTSYLWLKDGVGVANANGNSNLFSILSVAVSDTGNYQMVATTPYGLSVTSAMAFRWVTNPPVPPSITAQPPTNTVAFDHQDISLSVSAVGPPPLTYQWYYNNNVATGPNVSGADTPTLTITDVLADNGTTGAYYVVVSNPFGNTTSRVANVVSGGPVSVAYLRTLVDPVNYLATNSSTHWHVTGLVTTFTNVTSGDTASYYLWDGTAGINIFMTHGSTLQPLISQGDVVQFVGVLSSFNSTLELSGDTADPSTSITVLSNNIAALPAPKIIPFSITNNLAFCETNLESSIIMLTNVYFGTNSGRVLTNDPPTSVAVQNVLVTNAAGETFTLQFSPEDLDTYGQTLPSFAYYVIGPMVQNLANAGTPRNAGYGMWITRFSDVVTNPLSLNIQRSGADSVLTWPSVPVTLTYTVKGATSVTGPYTPIAAGLRFFDFNGVYTNTTSQDIKFYRATSP